MNNLNIPIYRAKKIDNDEYLTGKLIEDYGIGFYIQINNSLENICNSYGDYGFSTTDFEQIDITTLSVHFPDMLDSQGNKIFASLSENGKGGDLYIEEDNEGYIIEDENEINTFVFSSEGTIPYYESYNTKKVIGIQK